MEAMAAPRRISCRSGGELVPPGLVEQHLADVGRLVQTLQVVVLPHRVQAEVAVVGRADPLGRVDGAALRCRHDLAARQGDGGNAHLLEDLAGDARRRAVLHGLEVGDVLDRPLEPAERVGTHRLDHQRLHVDLQDVGEEPLVQLVAAAFHEPGDVAQLVEAGAGARHRVGEDAGRRMLAGPVVGPGIAAFHDALVDRIEDLEGRDDGAVGQHLDLDAPVRHLVDAVGVALEQLEVDAGRRHRRLHPGLLLGHGRRRISQQRKPQQRCDHSSRLHLVPPWRRGRSACNRVVVGRLACRSIARPTVPLFRSSGNCA